MKRLPLQYICYLVIRQSISRAIADQARTIRIPVHMVEIINRVMRSPDGLFRNWGGAYSSEIADQVHMPVKRVEEVLNMAQSRCLFETPVERKKIVIWWILYRMKKCHFFRTRHPLYFLHEQLVEVLQTLTPRETAGIIPAFWVV